MSLRVAVTGGIGSGKSVVCKVFSALGVPVYHADERARLLMNTDSRLKDSLIQLFGRELYDEDGLRRKWMAERIFGNDKLVEKVNSLVHPAVHHDFLKWADEYTNEPYVIEEAALTFESGGERFFDRVIVVTAPESLRVKRVVDRDGVDEEAVRSRMKHQMSQEEKEERAHFVIKNDNETMILPQILALHAELKNSI